MASVRVRIAAADARALADPSQILGTRCVCCVTAVPCLFFAGCRVIGAFQVYRQRGMLVPGVHGCILAIYAQY